MSKTARRAKEERAQERRRKREAKRRRNGLIEPPVETTDVARRVLIVCEGEKTEPLYFRSFPVNSEVASVAVEGLGMNTRTLVEAAATLAHDPDDGPYDDVWMVFDRDSFQAQDFNVALADIANRDRQCYTTPGCPSWRAAYSNEAFELWYLLHFDYCDASLSRTTYSERLAKYLGCPYFKNDARMYERLLERQPDAIRNAARLLACYPQHSPEKDNPSTTVHLLVHFLNRLAEAT